MKDEIILVDDEKFYAGTYRDALASQFVVHYRDTAHDAVGCLAEHSNVRALVLDIMMPVPEGVSAAVTERGLTTGLWLLQHIKETVIGYSIAVIVLTNRNPDVLAGPLKELEIPDYLVEVRAKCDTPAFLLPEIVATSIQQADARKR